jgi:hypothetical protein
MALQPLWLLAAFSVSYSILAGLLGHQLVTRLLPTHRTTQTQNENTHRHPCLEWDSNPRFQRSSKPRPRDHCDLILKYYLSIYFEGLLGWQKILSQDNQFPGRELNSEPAEYEAWMLPMWACNCTLTSAVRAEIRLKYIHRVSVLEVIFTSDVC